MTDTIEPIDVFTFSPAWGIPVPTASPFGVKVLTWMRMNDLPYRIHAEDNPSKGPKGKCPWAIVGGETIGDSHHIIEALRRMHGIDDDGHLDARERAIATSVRLMLEEHYHQVWEYEVFIDDGGWESGATYFDVLPPGVRVVVRSLARRALRKQLYARGVGRHNHAEIVEMGLLVLDTVDELLGDGPYMFGDQVSSLDATVFGFLSLTKWIPTPSKIWEHFASLERLNAYCDRMRDRYFPAE